MFAHSYIISSILVEYKLFSNRSIWAIDGTLTASNTPGQSGPKSNKQWKDTSHSPELQNWSLTTGSSLMSYSGHPSCIFF